MSINTLNIKRISFGINIGLILLLVRTCYKQYFVINYLYNPLLSKETVVDMYHYYLGLEFILIIGLIVLNTLSFFEKYKIVSILGILLITFGIIKLI